MKKMYKILLVTALVMCTALVFAACNNGEEKDPPGVNTYTMEAEYIDLSDTVGAGISSEKSGEDMIYGEGSDEYKNKGWSNGYYVGFTHSSSTVLNFVFNADASGSATIIVRLGSELGDITLTPENLAVKLNGTAISYSNMSIDGSESMESMKFFDKTVSTGAALTEGENTVSICVLQNKLRNGSTGGPMVDCVKIKTTSTLTWTDLTDNPGKAG